MALESLEVSSIDELVRVVLSTQPGDGANRPRWFRGHACGQYSLKSTLVRRMESSDDLPDTERRLINRFRQRSLPYWPAGYPQTDWEQLFAMQHHGIPTRLLDWSENLFVGLHFSAQPHEQTESHTCNPVVWVLDPIRWNQQVHHLRDYADEITILTTDNEELVTYAPKEERGRLRQRHLTPLAIYGTHNSTRIVAQRGAFTVAGWSIEPMESFASREEPTALWRVEINVGRQQLSRDLISLGFTESMIYPDLSGISREIATMEGV